MYDAAGTHFDHVGFIVPDLAAASQLMAQIGFTQTLRADHTRTDEQGQLVSAGSSQHSIMLERGYIELMQITDPTKGHQLAPATSVRFGLHILALGTANATDCHALCQSRGVSVGPLLRWSRPVNETGASGVAQFAYFGSAWTPQDPSYVCWVQHITPELMRLPPLLRHGNGALALVGVQYRGPWQLAQRWCDQLLAAGATLRTAPPGRQEFALQLPNALITIALDETLPSVVPHALVLEFSDCTVLTANCARLGIPVQKWVDGTLAVDLTPTLGMFLICRGAPAKGS